MSQLHSRTWPVSCGKSATWRSCSGAMRSCALPPSRTVRLFRPSGRPSEANLAISRMCFLKEPKLRLSTQKRTAEARIVLSESNTRGATDAGLVRVLSEQVIRIVGVCAGLEFSVGIRCRTEGWIQSSALSLAGIIDQDGEPIRLPKVGGQRPHSAGPSGTRTTAGGHWPGGPTTPRCALELSAVFCMQLTAAVSPAVDSSSSVKGLLS